MKEKRKTRLDKAGATAKPEFIGFSAFADNTLSAAAVGNTVTATGTSTNTNTNTNSTETTTLAWSPVYQGNDAALQVLFPRVSQKRDATTKRLALQELAAFFANSSQPKPAQVQALQHWAWLYHSKIVYDAAGAVRAAALAVWVAVAHRLPKAVQTLTAQQPELLGMLYTNRCDPDTQVRATAAANEAMASLWLLVDDAQWQHGIQDYASRILSYGRASVLHQAVAARKHDTPAAELTEQQKDAMEERFERLVGTTLQAIELWMRTHPESDATATSDIDDDDDVDVAIDQAYPNAVTKLWWKTLHSPKTSLRRKTCQLLATVCTHLSSRVPPDMHTILQQVLSSEKEAVNIPCLLEAVLAYLAHDASHADDTLTKPVGKLLKKACYGAKVAAWGPTLLPLVALFDNPLPLLQCLWEGRELTLGPTDKWALLQALQENASFALLRRRRRATTNDENEDENDSSGNNSNSKHDQQQLQGDTAQAIAKLWLQVLEAALSQQPTALAGAANVAYTRLMEELAKSLVSLQEASASRPNCAFYTVSDWFWTQGLTSVQESSNALALARLLQTMRQQPKKTTEPSLWTPLLRERFQQSLTPLQGSSGRVPSVEAYELFLAVFDFCGPAVVLLDGALEKFVMNDVLRWTVIHTSTLSTQEQSEELVQLDFSLLATCLSCVKEKRPALWESLLREVVAAKCHLEMLVVGLNKLLSKKDESVEWIQCPTLDDFVQKVGEENVENASKEITESSDDYDQVLELLQTCLGLSPHSSAVIVSQDVLKSLIRLGDDSCSAHEIAVSEDVAATPVLEVLLRLVQDECTLIEPEENVHLLLESWRLGGHLYGDYGAKCIRADSLRHANIVAKASAELRDQLGLLCSQPNSNAALVTAKWSDRAARLLEMCMPLSGNTEVEGVPSPSFALLGLADVQAWQTQPEFLFHCSKPLLRETATTVERLALIQGDEVGSELVVAIILSLSESSEDPMLASKARTRRDLSAQFLSLLGGNTIETSLLEVWIRSIVTKVSGMLKKGDDEKPALHRNVSFLSQLLDLLFLPLLPTSLTTTLVASEVKEGSELWYITDPNYPAGRDPAQVAKVHFDSQTGHYFSIRVIRDGEMQERQTVVERLRAEQTDRLDRGGVSVDSVPKDELSTRHNICTLIIDKLVKPYLTTARWTSSVPELVNVVVGHIGLGVERGLGTAHYEVFKLVGSIDGSLRESLSKSDTNAGASTLWTLALALGFGLNTPSTSWIFKEVRLDPEPSYRSILTHYDGAVVGTDPDFDLAVLAWLATSIDAAGATDKDNEERKAVIVRTGELLFRLASTVLQMEAGNEFSKRSMTATRAMYEGLRVSSEIPLGTDDDLATSLHKSKSKAAFELIRAFALGWEDPVDRQVPVSEPTWLLSSYFPSILELGRGRVGVWELLAEASTSDNANHLSAALFVDAKRYFALQLLDAVAGRGTALASEALLAEGTSQHLKAWSEGLDVVEAEELEEDVEIVSEWLPSEMMREIETWHEDTFHEIIENVSLGRLLTWLSVLRFIDSAAPKDFRNRPAFVSYLGKCEAVNYVLNLSLLFDKTINDRKGKATPVLLEMDDPLLDESSLELHKLASLVLFRTIEVLPSLSRRWWEEDCPKVYTNSVQSFLEKHVAPKILSSELARIKAATSVFGEMNVIGSLVSREVTATYVQDDFTLTVLIRLPASFPFRSAEVDCSKTLGVSQSRWKRWSLQIMLMLNSQGGTLQDALMLWKDNVDKEFQGVEPCPVCYSVLHVKTHKLPALECKTCHHRFHVDCLTQWFRSSGKSQCVLCQQPWQGSRIQ